MDEYDVESEDNCINLPLEKNAVPVFHNCLVPCYPLYYYCPHCGSNEPLTPLASYMPVVDLRFRIGMIGKLGCKTWDKKTPFLDRAVYIGLFLLFIPFLLLVGIPVVIFEKLKGKKAPPPESSDSD